MKKALIGVLLVVSIFILTYNKMVAQDMKISWDYPVKPGQEEWKLFMNSKEMISACQIPDTLLYIIPTDELIELCLRYPLIFDVFAFENILDGLAKYSNDFNGFQELVKRNDAAVILVQKYKKENPETIKYKGPTYNKKYDYVIWISLHELLLCNDSILSKLNHTEKIDLMRHYCKLPFFSGQSKLDVFH